MNSKPTDVLDAPTPAQRALLDLIDQGERASTGLLADVDRRRLERTVDRFRHQASALTSWNVAMQDLRHEVERDVSSGPERIRRGSPAQRFLELRGKRPIDRR